VLCEFGFVIRELILRRLELGFRVADELGFGGVAGAGVGKDAVFDEEDA
jgi:hypothetical protein